MKVTERMLRRIIKEEIIKARRKKKIQEGTAKRPVKITPAYLNRIIQEEYKAFQYRKRLVESRRRRARKNK